MGFLGSDPEIKNFENNRKLARLSLATNESYKNGEGNWVVDTQWHQLVMWDSQAVFAENKLEKGAEISVEGRLVSRSYKDKTGQVRYVTEIVVQKVLMLSKKSAGALLE